MQRKKIRSGKKKSNKHSSRGNEKEGQLQIRLNKFISNSGVCSRREADELIKQGKITVNGKVVTEMGVKVNLEDKVKLGSKRLFPEAPVYILLNKPKDFITTTNDPKNRKTVMDLVKAQGNSRIYPVGRLDRNTTGLLLFTNDGDLSKKLMHPSHRVKKVYKAEIDKPISEKDLDAIATGLDLDDGKAQVDKIAVLTPNRKSLGIEIHIGKNRIIRRIFEHLGYKVEKLDRVSYAGLTKKDLPRGNWRNLSVKEVLMLKHLD